MTSSITPISAASDGGTTTDSSPQEAPVTRERGIARLRETEVYHLMSLVESALYEAEHLVREVHDKARDRWLDHDHASEPLNADELSRLLSEAYQCTTLASTYIDKAAMGLLDPAAESSF
jgi:hypothetical protein